MGQSDSDSVSIDKGVYGMRANGKEFFYLPPVTEVTVWLAMVTTGQKEAKARIVMEVLSNSSAISEICRKYNASLSAVCM